MCLEIEVSFCFKAQFDVLLLQVQRDELEDLIAEKERESRQRERELERRARERDRERRFEDPRDRQRGPIDYYGRR